MDRISCFLATPFEQTLFLDVDCHVLASIIEVFDLLDVYDFVAAHAPGYRGLSDPEVPKSFSELNCGVIACRKNRTTQEALTSWKELYKAWYLNPPFDNAAGLDQPSFRQILWKHKIPIYVLAPEYNWRPALPSFLIEKPKILHGYHHDPESIAIEAERRGFGAMPPLMPHLTDFGTAIGPVE